MLNRLVIWVLALVIAASLPRPVWAHAILEDSVPPAGASVAIGKFDLRFRYNSRIDQARSRLTLIRADGSKTSIAISAGTQPDIIEARLDLPPGRYTVRWQVLATDGHITRGDVPFTVTAR